MLSPILIVASTFLLLAVLLAIAAGIALRRFLSQTPRLECADDLTAFRRAVARDMYCALAIIALVAAAAITVVCGIYFERAFWSDLKPLLALGGVFAAVSVWGKGIEARAKKLPVASEELQHARDHLVHIWTTKPFPNW